MTDMTQDRQVSTSQSLSERLGARMPYLVVPILALAGLAFIGNFPAWATLTLAGLAMGMMIFVMASGLTLVFGLMDVLNFGHGAFIDKFMIWKRLEIDPVISADMVHHTDIHKQ